MSFNVISQVNFTKQNTNFTGFSRGIGVDNISVVDENIVWIKGFNASDSGGTIKAFSRTNNGGTEWNEVNLLQLDVNEMPLYVRSQSYNKAYTVVIDTVTYLPSFWSTVDGGTLWTKKTNIYNFSGSSPDGINFWDSIHGFCYGEPNAVDNTKYEFYSTNDGGITWILNTNSPSPVPVLEMFSFGNPEGSAVVAGGAAFIITDRGRVLKTTDYGVTWAPTTANPFSVASSGYYRVYASSANFIICNRLSYNPPDNIWKYSTDGGLTWNNYLATGNFCKYNMAYVPGSTNMFVSSSAIFDFNMGASFTTDGFAWSLFTDTLLQRSGSNLPCHSIGFASSKVGWIGCYDTNSTFNAIVKYENPTAGINLLTSVNGNDVNIYPNPSTGIVNFSVNGPANEDLEFIVYDLMGKQVFTETLNVNSLKTARYDFSFFTKGVYLVKIISGNDIKAGKIVID